jgi:hypothetical protein
MNKLLKMLSGGGLRSDGRANEVAEKVIKNPDLFDHLVEGLSESDDGLRARTAHALERISRTHPGLMLADRSVFVKNWTIVSLTILGQKHTAMRKRIADKIRLLQDDRSIAIRSKVSRAREI